MYTMFPHCTLYTLIPKSNCFCRCRTLLYVLDYFNKFSPGKLLLDYLINEAIQNKLNKFDFGYGDENYKKYWSNENIYISSYINYKTIKGFLVYCLIKIYLTFKNIK